MKFIRHKRLGLVLFEPKLSHKEVAKYLGDTDEVISAGFVRLLDDQKLECYGESDSLKKKAKERDTQLLRVMFRLSQ